MNLIPAAPVIFEQLKKLYKQALIISDLRHNDADIDDTEWSELYDLALTAREIIDKIEK